MKTLSNWALGFVMAIICFIGTMDSVMISLAKDHQEILQAGVREQQHLKRPFIRHRGDWNPCYGNWTKLMWEADMLRLQREEMNQAKALSHIDKS